MKLANKFNFKTCASAAAVVLARSPNPQIQNSKMLIYKYKKTEIKNALPCFALEQLDLQVAGNSAN